MRRLTSMLLGALSVLVGVLTAVVTVYGANLADAWSREHIGLPSSFAAYHVVAPPGRGAGDASELLRLLGDAPAALVVSPGADTGEAALGVLDTAGTVPILAGIGAGVASEMSTGGAMHVVVVEGSYTEEQLDRSGTATFLPRGGAVVGTVPPAMLPRDTQYVYGLGSAPLPSGDYFMDAPQDLRASVVDLLDGLGYTVTPLERPPLSRAILQAPFTTVFAALLLSALACLALVVVNQFTFHGVRVAIHQLHGAHTRAMLRVLLVPGLLVTGVGTGLGAAAALLLAQDRPGLAGAGAGWAAAWCLTLIATSLGVVVGARQSRRSVL